MASGLGTSTSSPSTLTDRLERLAGAVANIRDGALNIAIKLGFPPPPSVEGKRPSPEGIIGTIEAILTEVSVAVDYLNGIQSRL